MIASAIAMPAPARATAPASAGSEVADTGDANRVVRPFYGSIIAFDGEHSANYGSIIAFNGPLNPFWGSIIPFWGDVSPFYGSIIAFWGDLRPFYGSIIAFEGDVRPFYGSIIAFDEGAGAYRNLTSLDESTGYRNVLAADGRLVPDYAFVGAFWSQAGAMWADIEQQWAAAGNDPGKLTGVRDRLVDFNRRSASFWGTAVQSATGKAFDAGFSAGLRSRYGIDLSDPSSLSTLSKADRSRFMLDWYDGLMAYSGRDHVDHWMKTANWTPRLTQIQGGGKDAVIGLVDFFAAADADIAKKVVYSGGNTQFTSPHGAAVGSLIVASHDGKGVMGIAPDAKVAAYNPFSSDGTASWAEVRKGIAAVTSRGAAVVNLSLGVPGWTLHGDWRAQFADKDVRQARDSTLYVIAAGNDGITQAQNVDWSGVDKTSMIVVGSVDPSGTISGFSNRPGNVCLTKGGRCDGDLLMNRFITAPGEMILVSDGQGGTKRMSGTSFAAPIVSGAIALIHDRWPWLKKAPADVTQIILRSARDAGAPGVDPVYGVGILDVEASQSPLDFGQLRYTLVENGRQVEMPVAQVRAGGVQASWNTNDAYFTAFERVGSSQRDFLIPLSSRLVGQTINGEQFQGYVYDRMVAWLGRSGFTDTASAARSVPTASGWRLTLAASPLDPGIVRRDRAVGLGLRMEASMRVDAPSGRFGFSVGQGAGALALGRQSGFDLFSDYDPQSGGVNPVLGFASGGAFAAADFAVTPALRISAGMTQQRRSRMSDQMQFETTIDPAALAALRPYRAQAANVRVDYAVAAGLSFHASFTSLDEASGLLGVRSVERSDFERGSRTDGLTVGADIALPWGMSFNASATRSRTSADGRNALRVADGGLIGTAYQVALSKQGLIGSGDRVRLTLSQPLAIERGALEMTSLRVIDRSTGATGLVTDRFDVASGQRRHIGEMLYALPAFGGRGELMAFGRGEIGADRAGGDGYMLGARARFQF